MKIIKFAHNEGAEIVAAANAKDAILFYFTTYQDADNTDTICQESGGIRIEELTGDDITRRHSLYDESVNQTNEYSYAEIAAESFTGEPVILVSPNY